MSYQNPAFLVETAWLESHLHDSELRVFDVTGMLTSKLENVARERHYAQGHIPGAGFLDVASGKGVLSDPHSALPWMWPPSGQVERVLSAAGVDAHSRVILYAATPRAGIDNGLMWCTRAWWTLHHMGVNCAILNGGWERWVAEGRATSQTDHAYAPARFRASSDGRSAVTDKAEVLAACAGEGNTCVVDALSAASFRGEDKARYGNRKGHIAGAVNVPMSELVDKSTGRFLEADRLAERLQASGLLSAERVITYCGGGIAATVDAFCLALLGHQNVAVYDASLFEWAPDDQLPMVDPSS